MNKKRATIFGLLRHWFKRLALRLHLPIGEYCKRCGWRVRQTWHAEDQLWVDITGRLEGGVCVDCFTKLAWKCGKMIYWRASLRPFAKDDP